MHNDLEQKKTQERKSIISADKIREIEVVLETKNIKARHFTSKQ